MPRLYRYGGHWTEADRAVPSDDRTVVVAFYDSKDQGYYCFPASFDFKSGWVGYNEESDPIDKTAGRVVYWTEVPWFYGEEEETNH